MTNSDIVSMQCAARAKRICWAVCVLGAFSSLPASAAEPFVAILGIAQDGGFPQAGCRRDCCADAWTDLSARKYVSCIAVVDPETGERFLLDCTPDFRDQLRLLDQLSPPRDGAPLVDGILLTHAHIGHYTGLMQLGREVLGTKRVPVFAMPRMKYFLETNGPWSQLVDLQQIDVRRIANGESVRLNGRISVTPFMVPHRDEFSETVGFKISCNGKSVAYLPDIDKWEKWDLPIESLIGDVELALLDGTFFDANELPGRDMSEIPHPFIAESIERLGGLPAEQRSKVRFIHLNHTNPLHGSASRALEQLHATGMSCAAQGSIWSF